MRNIKLNMEDECGIFVENKDKVPYISLIISEGEQKEIIQNSKELIWYETNGQRLFKIRNKKEIEGEEFMVFILLK